MIKKILRIALYALVIAVLATGALLFPEKSYAYASLVIALLACAAFFLTFEKRETGTKKILVISVMTALSVAGRFVFAPLPFFKPVTAIVVITALYMGPEAGFLTGALTAVISNFYFGQGPWTPFQMVVWGLLGFIAGLLARPLRRHLIWLLVYGAFAGIAFSMLMDIWTVLWYYNSFNLTWYLVTITFAVPITTIYAVSNVLFLLALAVPFGKKLARIQTKYGL